MRSSSRSRWFLSSVFPLLLSTFLLLGVSPAHGQIDIKPGVKAGLNLSTFGGEDADQLYQGLDSGRRTGIMVGGFVILDIVGPLALQPEVYYIQKGAKAEGSIQGTDFTFKNKLNYIEIPALAKFQIPVSGPITPTLFAGPAAGFNLDAVQELEGSDQSRSEDISDSVSSIDFGFHLGGGLDVGFGLGTLTLDVRYQLGLTNVVSEGDNTLTNRGIGVTAGVAF